MKPSFNPRRFTRVFPFLLLAVVLAVAGCTAQPTTTPGTTTSTTTTPTSQPSPSLTIVAPANGATLPPGDITVTVQVSNFSIVDKLGQANVAGQGHVHFFLDVDAPTTQGQPAVTAQGTYAAVAGTSYTWPAVPEGAHKLSVELVNNDHTPLNPPVVASVNITVAAPSTTPSVTILAPTQTINGVGDVTVTVQVSNFTLTNKLGQANVPGEGHLHYFLDVDPPTTPGQPAVTAPGRYAATADTSYTWHNVLAGTHKFSVELVNNDHTPLVPPVVATVTGDVVAVVGKPGLVITSPTAAATLPPGPVTVTVQTVQFTLASTLGGANVPGQGHIDYYLDVSVPTAAGVPAVAASTNFAAATATSYTWPDIAEGTHTFGVQLVNNDDTPLIPPVVAVVQITVKAPTPTAGTLQLFAIDAPYPGVDHINVTISNLETHQAGGAWTSLSPNPVTVDLMAIQGVSQLLTSLDLPPGTYTQVRFDVTACAVQIGSQTYQATVPTDKVRLVNPFVITLGQSSKVFIDFDASKDLVSTGINQFLFKPVIALAVPTKSTIEIVTQGLPNGQIGVSYSQSISWVNGTAYMWSISSGSLPDGLTLDQKGVISGMPATPGSFAFTVTVNDKNDPSISDSEDYSVRIAAVGLPLIVTTTLPTGEKGQPYSYALSVQGGTRPYTFGISTGALPAGLTLDSATGLIAGTPTATGDFVITLSCTDSSNYPFTDRQLIRFTIVE